MRILIVNEKFGEEGGAERYSLDVARELSSRKHEVGFLCEKNIKYQRSKIKNTNQSSKMRIWEAAGFDFDRVREVCNGFRPEVVYLQNVFDPDLTQYFAEKYPTFRFIHDHQTYCPGKSKMWFSQNRICEVPFSWRCGVNAFCKRCMSRRPNVIGKELSEKPRLLRALARLRKIIVASEFMKRQLLQNGIGEEKILVNPLFASREFEVKIDGSNKSNRFNGKEILFVGRVFIEKGLEYLLRALAMIKDDWHLNVIGDGWDLERCKRLSGKLGISERVDFLGFLPHVETARYFEEASVVAVPSIWPEPFCLVGLEAMAFGKPVVAFDVGGISTWLGDNETGFLVKRDDVGRLAEKIELLLDDRGKRGEMGERGRRMLEEQFSLDRHIGVLERLFAEFQNQKSKIKNQNGDTNHFG